jgi:hypothetical protein
MNYGESLYYYLQGISSSVRSPKSTVSPVVPAATCIRKRGVPARAVLAVGIINPALSVDKEREEETALSCSCLLASGLLTAIQYSAGRAAG